MISVEVDNLSKTYGTVKAVERFSFTAGTQEIVAVAGPDGAGKTSLFRSLCGLIRFDDGRAAISGHDVQRELDRIKPLLGYMPQTFSLYHDLSVEENLRFYAGLFGLNKRTFDTKKESLYLFSGLGPFRNRPAGKLSGGMKQKLALSCALIHDPRILILDEPTTGVDPLSRRQFWDILKELRRAGATIIVSTPYMDEVAQADRAVFMYMGSKLAEGTPAHLAALYQGQVYQVDVEPTSAHLQTFQQIGGIDVRRFGSALHVQVAAGTDIVAVFAALANAGVARENIHPISPGLEDVFIQLMGK